ncbi:ropporin-1-like protein [Myxocyprinus asiaticus]|uniref:ropporin-1-like protein n=1 Tax=Myxocyprinus asiaticus TaxID=70543 RepID=UPI0022228164|nr:ropporin-1-like protein [Myxocyprinus asiaticus]
MALMPRKVVIPPELPVILMRFTEDAIRTQPEDIIEWASLYFRALVQGNLPVRVVLPMPESVDLKPEILAAMHAQLGMKDTVSKLEVVQVWRRFGLAEELLGHIFSVGSFGEKLEWMRFFALNCSYLGGTLRKAMAHACFILSGDPTCMDSDACLSFEMFRDLYVYLGEMDREVSQAQIETALTYLEAQANAFWRLKPSWAFIQFGKAIGYRSDD